MLLHDERDEQDGQQLLEEQIELELRLLREQTTTTSVVSLSMLEIYNECIFDLQQLATEEDAPALKIRHHKRIGAYVEGLVSRKVHSAADILSGVCPPRPALSCRRVIISCVRRAYCRSRSTC